MNERLLIAEDDPTSLMILRTVLEKAGWEVEAVENGVEALKALKRDDGPLLAVLDRMMPGIDGAEVCRQLKSNGRKRPLYVILLTAMGRTEDIVTGLDDGADDYMLKPFRKEELLARVKAGLRVIELERQLSARVAELEEALERIKTLEGILPICMFCHKIRDEEESWQKLEEYINDHSDATFSHSICPDCLDKHYPEDGE